MIKVKDENGNTIQGLYKDQRGCIIVEKNNEYDRYVLEKKQQETINNLTNEISELKDLINKIISSNEINKNSTKGP